MTEKSAQISERRKESDRLLENLDEILKSRIEVTGKRKPVAGEGVIEALSLMQPEEGPRGTVNGWATEFGKAGLREPSRATLRLSWNQLDLLRFLLEQRAVMLLPPPKDRRRRKCQPW